MKANKPQVVYADSKDPESPFIIRVGSLVLANYNYQNDGRWYFGVVKKITTQNLIGSWVSISEEKAIEKIKNESNSKIAYFVEFLMGATERLSPAYVTHEIEDAIGARVLRLHDNAEGRVTDMRKLYTKHVLSVKFDNDDLSEPIEVGLKHLNTIYSTRELSSKETFLTNKELGEHFIEELILQDLLFLREDAEKPSPVKIKCDRHINVFFGENGYGKTNLLRLIASALRFDEETIRELSNKGGGSSSMYTLSMSLNGRKQREMMQGFGGIAYEEGERRMASIPVLGIGAARMIFAESSKITLNAAVVSEKAFHEAYSSDPFIQRDNLAMSSMILRGIYAWGLFHFQMQSISQEYRLTKLVNDVFESLTNSCISPTSRIAMKGVKRKGFDRLEIIFDTEGASDISVLDLSQGTFSVISIFILVYSFLESFYEGEDDFMNKSGIVLIDEIGAHLHPTWQAQILHLLHKHFPNVQFFTTAHNTPTKVGLTKNQVFTIEKNSVEPYRDIETPKEDYTGLSISDIAEQDLDDILDPHFEELKSWYEEQEFTSEKINILYDSLMELEDKGKTYKDEYKELSAIVDKLSEYIEARVRRAERPSIADYEQQIDILKKENEILKAKLSVKN